MKAKDIFSIVINVLLLPVYIAVFAIFLVIWLVLTLTGLGPGLQLYYRLRDDKVLDRSQLLANYGNLHVIAIPGSINSASDGKIYNLALRFTRPLVQPKAYICIPNGLGATIVILAKLQDILTEQGFAVLNFDRLGVGFSDDNPTGKSPTAEDLINECDYVMNYITEKEGVSDIKWILVGPSMGSVVAQCYIAAHPDKVVGFLNMDGVAYPFHSKRKLFSFAAKIYKIYPMIIWTGILRPFIGMAVKKSPKMFASDAFPISIPRAQLNQARFFYNIAIEMNTMMDCCEYAAKAWGALDITSLDQEAYKVHILSLP
jgi:pimeloyl-ACP methyl ester carboxylesterase